MRRLLLPGLAAMIAMTGAAAADDLLLPGFAWHHPGKAGNLWTSEIYVTNPTSQAARVEVLQLIPGRGITPGLTCIAEIVSRDVPPLTTVVLRAHDFTLCFQTFVGGLALTTEGAVFVDSRMTNERGNQWPDAQLLQGFGQEIPAVPFDQLPTVGQTYMFPSLIWQPGSCGSPRYETAVAFANKANDPVEVTLWTDLVNPGSIVFDGALVQTPYKLTVAALTWQQLAIAPPPSTNGACGEPRIFNLFFQVTGSVGAFASVVDRTTQDSRTVMPIIAIPRVVPASGQDPQAR